MKEELYATLPLLRSTGPDVHGSVRSSLVIPKRQLFGARNLLSAAAGKQQVPRLLFAPL